MYEAFISGFSTFVKTFTYTFFSYVDIELVAVVAVESAQDLAIKATFWGLSYSIFWLSWRSFAYDVLWYVLINILSFLSLFFEHSLQTPISTPPPSPSHSSETQHLSCTFDRGIIGYWFVLLCQLVNFTFMLLVSLGWVSSRGVTIPALEWAPPPTHTHSLQ